MGTYAHFDPASDPECYEPRMTRADAIARRTAGTLRENCVVVITDGPVIGTPGNTSPTEIELNPVSPTELGLTARVHTTFDNSAWAGTYDIDLGVAGSITRLTDSSQNTVVDNDADSPTVHTQFPWHLGTTLGVGGWRDNYVEDFEFIDANLAVLPRTVVNNKFYNVNATSALNFTDWVSGTITDCEIGNFGGAHKIFGVASWTRSKIISATVNATTDIITLTGSEIVDNSSLTTTGNGNISVSASRIEDTSIVLNAGENNISITNSTMSNLSQINSDAGALKTVSLAGSTMNNARIRVQGGTVNKSVSFTNGTALRNRPGVGDSILVLGDASVAITSSSIVFSSQWTIDGNTSTNLQFISIEWLGGTVTTSLLATNNQWSNSRFQSTNVTVTGPGDGAFSTSITGSFLSSTQIRMTGTGDSLSLGSMEAVGSVIAIDGDSPRGLTVDGGSKLMNASVIETGTVISTNVVGSQADRVFNCIVNGGVIEFATTAGGTQPHNISNCMVMGGPNAPGIPDGIIRIDGVSERINIFSCEVWGELTITDVPDGGLSGPTSMYDNYIGSSCNLRYIAGDNVEKQIRNNRIEGNASSILCTGLTGTAGAGLGDVFSGRVANQSTLTVTGTRVPGFPVRNFTVENGSTLTIPANGSVLQVALKNNADFDTAGFVHFDSEISGNFSKVATAANLNALCNKSYDDFV